MATNSKWDADTEQVEANPDKREAFVMLSLAEFLHLLGPGHLIPQLHLVNPDTGLSEFHCDLSVR